MTKPEIFRTGLTRRQCLTTAAALPVAAMLPRHAHAAEFTYKLATGQDPSHPVNKRAQEAIDRIKEATKGRPIPSEIFDCRKDASNMKHNTGPATIIKDRGI